VLAQGVPVPSGGLRAKLLGVPTAWVDEVAGRFRHLLILVEADGSTGRPPGSRLMCWDWERPKWY